MSRGLGKVQRAVLAALDKLTTNSEYHEAMRVVKIDTLALVVYHADECIYQGEFWLPERHRRKATITRSETVAIHRAVKMLERQGLIGTRIEKVDLKIREEPGGALRWLLVSKC